MFCENYWTKDCETCVFDPSRNRFAPVSNNSVLYSNFYRLNVFNCPFANTMFLFFRLSRSFFLHFSRLQDEKESQPRNFLKQRKVPITFGATIDHTKSEKEKWKGYVRKHLSRYVIYFLCTIYLSRPILHASSFIPSTPFAICFFNGLLLATNVRVIAVYQSIYARSIQSALHHVHFLSSVVI